MDNTKPSSFSVALKWGVISALTSIIITYAFQFMNLDQSSGIKYLGFIPFIAFMFLAQKEFKDQSGGYMTFGQGFVTGLLFSIVGGVIGAVFSYVYYKYLSPQIWDQILATQKEAMAGKNLTDEQVDQAMAITQKYGLIITFFAALIGTPFIGAIVSLIGAAIFKKERSPFDANDNSYTEPSV